MWGGGGGECPWVSPVDGDAWRARARAVESEDRPVGHGRQGLEPGLEPGLGPGSGLVTRVSDKG